MTLNLLSMKWPRAAIAVLAALLGLIQLTAAPSARANTTETWTVMYWDITTLQQGGALAAQRYDDMVRELRQLTGYTVDADHGGVLGRTEAQVGRYIEIRITDNGNQFLSLFYRTNNLYLDGFRMAGSNYRFNDAQPELTRNFGGGRQLFTTIYSGSYQNGGLDVNNARANTSYIGPNLRNQFMGLTGFNYNTRENYRLNLANIVQATSEAARFGWIQNRISNTIRNGGENDGNGWQTTLGAFGIALENRWAPLTRLAFRSMNGGAGDPVEVDGRIYRNLTDMMMADPPRRPRISYLLGLGSQAG
ncbi:ribosome-inactivating family protein [Kitasatospora sp. NPDC001159]